MTARAEVRIDPARTLGRIDERVYGQFIEHVGRAVYGGVHDPGNARSDGSGLRLDVVEACRELGPSVLRWPGGNFASGYHWRDGIGPVADRPTRRDLAWGAVETNAFGTEEFLELARRLDAAPYLNLNVSTGTVDEALGWLDYCNGEAPVPEVLARRAGPHPAPHGVPIWGLGNENYGWWQHGHTSAGSYAETAREWAKLLRWQDPDIALVAVGAPDADWNWTVLNQVSRVADYLSLHCYWHGNATDPYASILAGPVASEQDVIAAYGMALAAQRRAGVAQPVRLAIDEWGVWARTMGPLADLTATDLMRNGLSARSGLDTSFEEDYDLKDALAVATWLHVMWRHPEKVGMATLAQMVNVLAPLHAHSEGVVRHTVFWPLAVARRMAGSVALDVHVSTEAALGTGGQPGVPGDVLTGVDCGATLDPQTGRVHVSLVNRLRDQEVVVDLLGVSGPAKRVLLWHDDPFAGNTVDAPTRVVPVEDDVHTDGLVLPPHSHTTLLF